MMNEHNEAIQHMSNSVINPNPAKRRRGRPRKEGHFHRKDVGSSQQASPIYTISETATKQSDENMIGKPVSGVIDGCFDAGFLLSVKIGNNGPILRGVVFEQGKVVPLTSTNDIAPQVKLHQRREIPANQAQNDIGFQSESLGGLSQPASSSAVAVISLPSILSNTSSTMNQNHNFKFGSHFMMPSSSVENLRMVEQDDVMQVYEVSVQSDQRLINPDTESAKNITTSSQSPARQQSDVMGSGLHLNSQIQNDFLRCTTDSFLEDISAKKPVIELNSDSYFSPQQQNAPLESGFHVQNDISDEHLHLEETSVVAQTQDDTQFKDHRQQQQFDNELHDNKNVHENEHTRPNQEAISDHHLQTENRVVCENVIKFTEDNDPAGKNDGSNVDLQGTNNSGVTTMPLDLEIAVEESTGPGRPEFDFSSSIGCNNEREN